MTINAFGTIVLAVAVLLLGHLIVSRISFFQKYNLPEPVIGGLVAAIIVLAIHSWGDTSISFNTEIQSAFMLMFFTSVGLSASLGKLKEGGKALVMFMLCMSAFVVLQNFVGISMATALGLEPLVGLIVGSITLVGGHGTAGAWGSILEEKYAIEGAIVLGMASATMGLILGGVLGGPIAKFMIKRHKLQTPQGQQEEIISPTFKRAAPFEYPEQARLINADDAVKTLGMFALCIVFAQWMTIVGRGQWFELPTFVWALMGGVILRNSLEYIFHIQLFDRCIDVFGNASLSLYLAMALMGLKLWMLVDLAGPLIMILAVQAMVLMLYLYFVTFRVMGKNYDAAVLSAGMCGVGMGATPTAMANIQALTNAYGPSHKAFLLIPLCGAFFIDIVNATVIQTILSLF